MARRHRKPSKTAQFKLVALGAVTFLPNRQEVIRAAAYLHPDVLCTVSMPNGDVLFQNAAAREVTGLGRSALGSALRQKAQAKRAR